MGQHTLLSRLFWRHEKGGSCTSKIAEDKQVYDGRTSDLRNLPKTISLEAKVEPTSTETPDFVSVDEGPTTWRYLPVYSRSRGRLRIVEFVLAFLDRVPQRFVKLYQMNGYGRHSASVYFDFCATRPLTTSDTLVDWFISCTTPSSRVPPRPIVQIQSNRHPKESRKYTPWGLQAIPKRKSSL